MLPNQTTNVFVSITEIEGDRNTECTLNVYVKLGFEYLSNGIVKVCMNIFFVRKNVKLSSNYLEMIKYHFSDYILYSQPDKHC